MANRLAFDIKVPETYFGQDRIVKLDEDSFEEDDPHLSQLKQGEHDESNDGIDEADDEIHESDDEDADWSVQSV